MVASKWTKTLHIIELRDWNFLFLFGALLVLIAVNRLGRVKETGEVGERMWWCASYGSTLRSNLTENFLTGSLIRRVLYDQERFQEKFSRSEEARAMFFLHLPFFHFLYQLLVCCKITGLYPFFRFLKFFVVLLNGNSPRRFGFSKRFLIAV